MSTTHFALNPIRNPPFPAGPTSSWWPYYLAIDRLARVRDQVKVPTGVYGMNQ
jgi:hypothetical protein